MNQQQILEEMLDILENNGIEIRQEPLGASGGGLCAIKGRSIFYLNTQASVEDSIEICLVAIKKLVDIENIYMRPQIRQIIESYSNIK
jgi:hypothetical protein